MPQKDQYAAELDHAEEVGDVASAEAGKSAEVLSHAISRPIFQRARGDGGAAALSFPSLAPVGSDHFDAVHLAKPRVQRVTIVFARYMGEQGSSVPCQCRTRTSYRHDP